MVILTYKITDYLIYLIYGQDFTNLTIIYY